MTRLSSINHKYSLRFESLLKNERLYFAYIGLSGMVYDDNLIV